MHKLRIIFAGAGAFGLPTLRALLEAGHEIMQVITQPDRPAGRGRKLTPTPIGQFAIENNLPLVRTENINAMELPDADVMVVIAFGQKIAPHQVNHPHLGSLNLHASILPKYRGAAPINWAILNGETETGNSIIRLAEKMDAGAVLAQSRFPIDRQETAGELHDRLALDGAPLIVQCLRNLTAGEIREQIQDESLATVAPKLSRQNTLLDFTHSAEQVARQIRALSPWPGCRVRILDNEREVAQLNLLRAVAGNGSFDPQSIGKIQADGTIACNASTLRILEVQPQGKNAMSLSAYRNGRPWPVGGRLETVVN